MQPGTHDKDAAKLAAFNILYEVAEELAQLAESSMQPLREGEVIASENLVDGVYCRQTQFQDKTFEATFDFRTKQANFYEID